MSENKNPHQIDIELNEQVAEGIYSNLVIISHSTSEFVFDFVKMLPGLPKAQVKSRLILGPEHAKRLLLSLEDNLRKYEATFGEINIPKRPGPKADFPFGFGNGSGEA